MRIMPVALRLRERKFFQEHSLALNVLYHFLNRNIIIADGRCLTITIQAKMFKLHHQRRLVRFCTSRNSERINKRKIETMITDFQDSDFTSIIPATYEDIFFQFLVKLLRL